MPKPVMRFDRTVSSELLAALQTAPFAFLKEARDKQPDVFDLQLRRDGASSWATLYFGLVGALRVDEREGKFKVSTHDNLKGAVEVDWPGLVGYQSLADLLRHEPLLRDHLEELAGNHSVRRRYVEREGVVHAAIACADAPYAVIQREAKIGFRDSATRDEIVGGVREALAASLGEIKHVGTEADFLAVDEYGRLLVIEAKPVASANSMRGAVDQALMYALLFRRLASFDSNTAATLNAMLQQRVTLGLSPNGYQVVEPVPIVPVIAVHVGAANQAVFDVIAQRISQAADLLNAYALDPPDVWFVDCDSCTMTPWSPAITPIQPDIVALTDPACGASGFVAEARRAAAEWKQVTTTLDASHKLPAGYDGSSAGYPFCLPVDAADRNLLSEARSIALERFAAAGIPWHRGIGGGPSNHLLSSQVHCANSLAPFVGNPSALREIFAPVLPIDEVLPFAAEAPADPTITAFDRTDHVVFEWTAQGDYLNEHPNKPATRGANNTSADAAIRYRATDGVIEVALIEWKYTERYAGADLGAGTSGAVRKGRYDKLFHDPAGPIRTELLGYEHCFVEPLYQLMRQQLLAWQMEQHHDLGAERVRLVVVAPERNLELAKSFWPAKWSGGLSSSEPTQLESVHAIWKHLVRVPDRFHVLDSAHLLTPTIPMSEEYRLRYGHLAPPN